MYAELNGLRVNYQLDGPIDAPWLVMSHALATTHRIWDWQMPVLKERYRVLRYDTRGHGETEVTKAPYTIEQLADDLFMLLDWLHIDSAHFVGLSMGGMIGQAAALAQPSRFNSLVLADTTSQTPPEIAPIWETRIRLAQIEGMKSLVRQTLDRWLSMEFEKQSREDAHKIQSMILKTPEQGFVGCCQAIIGLDLSDRLSEINLPTLLLVGAEDPGTPVEVHEAIHAKISGSALKVLPNALHLSNVEQAAAFNTALLDFLDTQTPRGQRSLTSG